MEIKTFKEWLKIKESIKEAIEINDNLELCESPVAVLGDWDGFKDDYSIHIGYKGFDKGYYKVIGKIKSKKHTLKIVQGNGDLYYIGDFGTENYSREDRTRKVFVVFAQCKIQHRKNIKDNFKNYNKPIQMRKIETSASHRLSGYASLLYMYFINEGYQVISDIAQFDGDRRIFSKLSKDKKIQADIIDDVEYKTLSTNVEVHQGYNEWDFDTNIWSYDFDKADIKIVLRKKQ